MSTHVVEPGEHISGIAARFGFGDFHRIWDDAANAELRQRRPDPHVLFAGDVLSIPDRQDRVEALATTQVHTAELDDLLLFLPLAIKDLGNRPVANAAFELRMQLRAGRVAGSTDAKGHLAEEVSRLAKAGELRVTHTLPPLQKGEAPRIEILEFDLHIGGLDPVTTFSGQQQRLNNLGYFAGFTVLDQEQMQWAVEEFQCDHLQLHAPRQPPVIVPQSDEPTAITGVQDQPTRQKLEQLHGI